MSERSGAILVKKFGGSSVADVQRIRAVAQHVVDAHNAGNQIVVVVSAMGKTTDELVRLAGEAAKAPDRREMDMLLTAGERIAMSLLAMAIRDLGVAATSLTGSQSGIITNDHQGSARIVEVRPYRIEDALRDGHVVIVAGFQGVSYRREVTTLGRGGSDTTAVALAAALGAEHAEIYSDIDGVYTADPRMQLDATRLAEIDHDAMLSLATAGTRVLAADAVAYARDMGIALFVRAADGSPGETLIRAHAPQPPSSLQGVACREDAVVWRYQLGASKCTELDRVVALGEGATIMVSQVMNSEDRYGTIWAARPPGDKSGAAHQAWLGELEQHLVGHGRSVVGTVVSAVFAGAAANNLQFDAFLAVVRRYEEQPATARCAATCMAIVNPVVVEQVVGELLTTFGCNV